MKTKLKILTIALMTLFCINVKASSVNITGIRTEHNVYKNGAKGMYVVLNFSISDCSTKQAEVCVHLFDANDKALKAPNSSFDDIGNGDICVTMVVQPIHNPSYFNDVKFFIPYAAFRNLPSGQLHARAYIFVKENANDEMLAFKAVSANTYFNFSTGAPANRSQVQNQVTPTQALINTLLNPTFNFDFSNIPTNPPVNNVPYNTPQNNYPTRERCLACHGTGRIEGHLYAPSGNSFWCSECQRVRVSGHYHTNCPGCYGTGYIN